MEDTQVAELDTFPHKVYVKLDVLRSLVMDGIGGHIDG
jgi:hypothetical protein